jgi:hypothetical protein
MNSLTIGSVKPIKRALSGETWKLVESLCARLESRTNFPAAPKLEKKAERQS